MAAPKTPDELREKIQRLRARLREAGEGLDLKRRRALKKKIRRLQRRRRRLLGAGRPKPQAAGGQPAA